MRRLLCLAALLITMFAVTGAAHSAPVMGVNAAGLPSGADIAEAQSLGSKQVRMFLSWRDGEPSPGAYNEGYLNAFRGIVAEVTSRGMQPLFVVTTSPSWASGSGNPDTPPRDPATMASFMAHVAGDAGFAGRGIAWEVWNEEDEAAFWSTGPNPAAYVGLFNAVAPAIQAADPSAQVILGPTTGNNYAWVDALYKNGLTRNFTAVAVHTDTACLVNGPSVYYRENGRIGRFSFLGYREVRATILANGDNKPIWMSEFGWSSTQKNTGGGPTCARGDVAGTRASGVNEDNQSKYLSQAIRCMSADPYVEHADWFVHADDPHWALDEARHYGLKRSNGAHKPSWDAFQGLATGAQPVFGGCGDFGGPSLIIKTPKLGKSYRGALKITVVATDAGGILGIRYFADGKKFTSVNKKIKSGKPVTIKWQGAKKLRAGNHTIKVVALDKKGNETPQSVLVKKVGGKVLAVGPPVFKVKHVICKGKKCTFSGKLSDTEGKRMKGTLQVQWQLRKGTKWKTVKRAKRSAGKSFKFKAKVKANGAYRVVLKFKGKKPIKGGSSDPDYFAIPWTKPLPGS